MIPSKIYIGWNKVEELVDSLCYQIQKHKNIEKVTGLSRGGLIPAVMVSHTLGLRFVDSQDLIAPFDTFIIDDICDSGLTLENWEGYKTAVLHYKPHTSSYPPTIYANLHEGDEWIIYPWEKDDSETLQDYLK
jgi:hypothetical protein